MKIAVYVASPVTSIWRDAVSTPSLHFMKVEPVFADAVSVGLVPYLCVPPPLTVPPSPSTDTLIVYVVGVGGVGGVGVDELSNSDRGVGGFGSSGS